MTAAMDKAILASLECESGEPTCRSKSPKGNQTSKHNYMQNYLTEKEWKVLKNPTFDLTSKLRMIGKRCMSIGMKHFSEDTARRIAAIVLLADHQGPISEFEPNPVEFRGTVEDVKVIVKQAWKGSTKSDLRIVYPSDPRRLGVTLLSIIEFLIGFHHQKNKFHEYILYINILLV